MTTNTINKTNTLQQLMKFHNALAVTINQCDGEVIEIEQQVTDLDLTEINPVVVDLITTVRTDLSVLLDLHVKRVQVPEEHQELVASIYLDNTDIAQISKSMPQARNLNVIFTETLSQIKAILTITTEFLNELRKAVESNSTEDALVQYANISSLTI